MMLGLQGWIEWGTRQAHVRETELSLINLAISLTHHADDTIEIAEAAVDGLVERLDADGTSPQALERLQQKLAAPVTSRHRFSAVTIIGADGRWLASSLPIKEGDFSDRSYFRHHRDDPDNRPFLGPLIVGRATGQWNITVSRRFHSANGDFAGIVLAGINLSYFVDHFATYDLGQGSSIALLKSDGTLIARYPSNDLFTGKPISASMAFSKLREDSSGSYEGVSPIDGAPHFAGYSRSDRYPLVVVAAMSKEQALRSWRTNACLDMAIALSLTGAVGMLCLNLARQIWRSEAAQEALRKSEEFLDRAGRLAGVGGWEVNIATNKPYWSAETCRIHGVAPGYEPTVEEAINFYAPEARPVIAAALERCKAEGVGWDLELPLVRIDGVPIWVRAVGSVTLTDGKRERVMGALQDITDRIVRQRALELANERLTLAADSGGIGIWDWDVTNDKLVWDHWMYRLHGMQPRDDVAAYELWKRHLHPDDRASAEAALAEGVKGNKPFDTEFRIVWDDGSVRHIRGCGRVRRDPEEKIVRIVGANWDVTERAEQHKLLSNRDRELRATIAQLDVAHQQLDATLTNLPQGVTFYNNEKELVVFNKQYGQIYGLPDGAIQVGASFAAVKRLQVESGNLSRQTAADHEVAVERIIRDGNPHSDIVELLNGRTISTRLQPLPGQGWVATHEDITVRREAEKKIAYLARYDTLTGLANRAVFKERFEHALTAPGEGCALLYLDLDRFKVVNDTMGHPAGDSLLCAVADRLRDVVRKTDTIARLGGDEFAILQIGVCDTAETTALANRIVRAIAEPFEIERQQVSVGASIGIAMAPGVGLRPEILMKQADLALYRSKQEGRGTWRFFEPAMDAAVIARSELEIDLRRAVSLEQFELHYQPLVSSGDRRMTGFEALLRWRHPTRGLVPPGEFILVAEQAGLIGEIGDRVLHEACREAASWPSHMKVAVNLSTRQFLGQTLVTTVADAIRTAGLSPERLELEITESVPLREDLSTLETLHELQALGVRVALDDFGTGYSSLSYLRGFPFDTIKIDQSFVGDLTLRDPGGAIVRGIIGLAANLRMNVTAEGVETEGQFEFLASAGCTEIQGFLIGKPVPAHEIPGVIDRLSCHKCSTRPTLASATLLQ